jgi:multisubunit Na+/H+ antiporter MnhE subunit
MGDAQFSWNVKPFPTITNRFSRTGFLLGLVGVPVMLLFNQIDTSQHMTSYVMLLMIALMFWSLMVTAHIFRMSLDIKPGIAAILTVAYTVFSLIVVALATSGAA